MNENLIGEDLIGEILECEPNDDDGWILELETALLSDCDINVVRKISSQKHIPNNLRFEYWQVCLGIKGRSKVLEDIFDLSEQNIIRQDCQKLVDKLDNSSAEQLSILSDLESIITNFSRLNNCPYDSQNGWIELLETLLHLNIKRDELFKVFETIQLRYIPKYYNSRDQNSIDNNNTIFMQPFHLLRLLVLYHDPELCNYFDTLKLTPDCFSSAWFRSLFCSLCDNNVSLTFLDNYITHDNSFLIFFLSLVMIINLRDELIAKENKEDLISTLTTIPSSMCESDIKDMFFIAEQHFLNETPLSIKDFQNLFYQVFCQNKVSPHLFSIKDLSTFLCLPISTTELLSSCQSQSHLQYFVVDCRPPDQYNNGHLSTAFHLDCSLMLNDPSAFSTAVQALLASQKQAIEAKSIAGGEHLCFMGSGRDEEDCYVHMVVSSFLQKHHKYVCLLYGGYNLLHKYIADNQCEHFFVDHNKNLCLACQVNKSAFSSLPDGKKVKEGDQLSSVFFQRFSTMMKPKFTEIKEKLVEYVANPSNQKPTVKHVSSRDKLGKRYKGNKFSLDDSLADFDDDSDINCSDLQEINIEDLKLELNAIGCFECLLINADSVQTPGYLLLTETSLQIIKESSNKKGYGVIAVKRPLETVVQITSKRKCPEIITFRYGRAGQNNESTPNVKDKDSLLLVKPFDVIRMIKQQIVKILDQDQ